MKKIIIFFILLALISGTCRGAEVISPEVLDTSDLTDALPDSASEVLDGIEPRSADLKTGLSSLWDKALGYIRTYLMEAMGSGFAIVMVCMLTSVVTAFAKSGGFELPEKLADVTGVVAIMIIVLIQGKSIIAQCIDSVATLNNFSTVFIPVFAVATAITGHPITSVANAGAALMFTKVVTTLAQSLFLPALNLYLVIAAAGAISDNPMPTEISKLTRNAATTVFKWILMIFTGYIGLSGLISGSADAAAVRTAQVTISGAIPVVGGIVSGVSEALLVGATVLRASVGVYGFIAAVAICLLPFIRAFSHFLVYRVLEVVASSFAGPGVAKMLSGISSAYSIAIGILGTCCAIQFLAIVIGMAVTAA